MSEFDDEHKSYLEGDKQLHTFLGKVMSGRIKAGIVIGGIKMHIRCREDIEDIGNLLESDPISYLEVVFENVIPKDDVAMFAQEVCNKIKKAKHINNAVFNFRCETSTGTENLINEINKVKVGETSVFKAVKIEGKVVNIDNAAKTEIKDNPVVLH